MSTFIPLRSELVADLIESLELAGCQFWACEGETLAPIDMVTCHRCIVLAQLRHEAAA